MNQAALSQYQSISVQSGITDATPHQMVAMLFDGALDRVSSAKGSIARNEAGRKGELLGSAIAIVDGIRASLDYEKGGEIAANLGSLYDYIERRLLEANVKSDVAILDEVSSLLKELKAGWESIPHDIRKASL
ncbi:MAG: flagellar export chaperone FliS [Porticoccaceae bacterium]|nr:flagellar export chaperone FliS [Pseudomonadales bacterium]MCP5173020.1 flagellar export chaperone FliS [Pseudomonadales bacterium]MCP5302494.1 flagellar export chaperone FliS [Pseudomonadales bacterium]